MGKAAVRTPAGRIHHGYAISSNLGLPWDKVSDIQIYRISSSMNAFSCYRPLLLPATRSFKDIALVQFDDFQPSESAAFSGSHPFGTVWLGVL
jgi:hypothetical protein